MQRIALLLDNIKSSLWFLPFLLAVGAGLLSVAARSIPTPIVENLQGLDWLIHGAGAKHAHELLSNLLTAMITMTSLVMSLTMVVLTLAAGQLGPRLIRHFMASRMTQATIGIFIGTIVYLLLTLREINETMTKEDLPQLAITLGSLLSLFSIIMLVFFIHHLARSIVADEVIAQVGKLLDKQIASYLDEYGSLQQKEILQLPSGKDFSLKHSGYIQTIDKESIMETLEQMDGYLVLDVRIGHHVLVGGRYGTLMLANPAHIDKIHDAITIGSNPTPIQDIVYSVRQLVEVALRALSPSINDPFTAIRVLDRLSTTLSGCLALQSDYVGMEDKAGICRFNLPLTSFAKLLDVSLNQIRQMSEDKPDILIHMLEVLKDISEQTTDGYIRNALGFHAAMIMRAAKRKVKEQNDLEDVKKVFATLLSANILRSSV